MATKQLSTREQLRAIGGVAALSLKTAPFAVAFKLVGSLVNALLPIATTYYAAKTTTALAAAYGGNPQAHHNVVVYIIITTLLGLVMTVWSSLDNYIQAKMRYVVETRITNQMYQHFLALDFWRYDDKQTIDTYDRALKFSQFFAWAFDRLATVISNFIAAVSAVVALLFVNWVIALIIFIALAPGVYVQVKLSRTQIKHWNEHVESRRTLGMLEWLITQPRFISELRLYNLVDHLLKRRVALRDNDELRRIEIERRSIPWTLLSDLLTAAAEVASLLWIGGQVIARRQPIGQFLYVQQLVSRAMGNVSSLVSSISTIDEDVANLFDYQQFMQLPERISADLKLPSAPTQIVLDHVSFRYPGEQSPEVLRDITLTINRGQHIAIVGENGAGKSTLINLLVGLYVPTAGRITLDGTDLREIDVQSWHRQLSVLQQDFIAYDFASARDNIAYGDIDATPTESRLNAAMHDAEASTFIRKLPEGVDSYVNNWMETDDGVKGTDLSGGQWQRLALARNFYRNSPIVILDEPTSAIDALAEARIFERLFTEKERTIIAISHRLSTIKKADIIYMLEDGKVIETGTHDELVAKKGRFYTMFEAQIHD